MSAAGGRVPFTFPISVAQGDLERYRQLVEQDAKIDRMVVFFPKGTRTDLRLTPVVDGDPINETEATDASPEIPEYLIGSGTNYEFDIDVEVFQGQDLGVNADNVSSSSDLDAFVAFVLDYSAEVSR